MIWVYSIYIYKSKGVDEYLKERRSPEGRGDCMGMKIKKWGLLICVLMLNATCYIVQFSTAGLKAQLSISRNLINHILSMACIDVNPPEYRGRFATKGMCWLPPTGMWASLPRVPSHTATTLADIKGLLLFLKYIFDSLVVPPLTTVKKWVAQGCAQNAISTALLVY